MNRIGPSSVSTTVSIASRVVPGMSCTTARSSPISRLNSVDLPTFGRPTIATPGMAGPLDDFGSSSTRLDHGKQLDELVEQIASAEAVQRA